MNKSEASSRWVREMLAEGPATASERPVLEYVLAAMRRIKHGTVEIALQDGRPIQINTTEKRRL